MKTENVFQSYLTKKYSEVEYLSKDAGPVITISRETGCFAASIAELLVKQINSLTENDDKPHIWSWISKEILEKSAQELNTQYHKISHIFEAHKRKTLDDLTESFIKNFYLSDRLIIKAIKEIIRSYALKGNIIIIGRASSIIANDIPRSLHIKLIAPFDYRVEQLHLNTGITVKEAKATVADIDNKRKIFNQFYCGNNPEIHYYDIVLNRAKLSENQIVDLIMDLAKKKKLI